MLQSLSRRQYPIHGRGLAALGVGHASHVSTHMAIGFLFLGGGNMTFATDNASIGALLVACYPRFPSDTLDNRCHLQVCMSVCSMLLQAVAFLGGAMLGLVLEEACCPTSLKEGLHIHRADYLMSVPFGAGQTRCCYEV